MKNRQRRLMAILLGAIAILSWVAILPEYSAQHTYYTPMIQTPRHRLMLVGAIVVTGAGLWIQRSTHSRWKTLCIRAGVIVTFGIIHAGAKGGLTAAGVFGLIWKHLWIIIIAGGYLASIHAVGSLINRYRLHLRRSTTHIALTMAIGLVANILIMYVLMLVGGLYAPVVWLVFIGMGAALWYQRSDVMEDYHYLHHARSTALPPRSGLWRAQQALLVAAIVYLLYGMQLAFIPYSTARDANHAYMFFPKIRADNHGLYRSNGPWTSPFIRYAYIAQWFSSMERLTPITGIARDTVAVLMNFITSAVGILTIGTVMIDTVSKWLTTQTQGRAIFSLTGGALLLSRLTSGMGAFLVFVDNKTDLGVLLLVIVAMMSGFLFLRHMHDDEDQHNEDQQKITRSPQRYAIVSGIFFGVAFLGKPTAFIDIAGFVTMVVGAHMGILAVVALGAVIVGALAALQIRSVGTYLEPSASNSILGGLLLIPAALVHKIHRSRGWVRLLLVRGVVLVATIVIGKLPYLLPRADDRSGSQWMKSFLLSSQSAPEQDNSLLLAATGEIESLSDIDDDISSDVFEPTPSLDQCTLADQGVTMDDLRDRQREVIGGGASEDNGRYVGYGQRTLTADNAGVRYHLAKALFPSDDGCYAAYDAAAALCEARDNITIDNVQSLATRLGTSYPEIETIATRLSSGDIFAQDAVSILTEFYTSRTILTTTDSVAIPYRRLVPANITFNRSLQNESSYYTDIGIVWLPALLITILGLIRGVIIGDRKIIALTGATLVVWIAWMLVADGIVRYGMGMIIWTILAAAGVVTRWITGSQDTSDVPKLTALIVLAPLVVLILSQWTLNMMRISSQGSGGPFVSYKQGIGTLPDVTLADGQLTAQNTLQTVNQEDILRLQFPHYFPVINHLEERQSEDGVFIAGTYLQYFLRNQSNIRSDNLVTSLWREMSDSDVCATYLRLRDTGYRTIILDPNIATVVLGEGNQSLKERFIMKEDDQGTRIDDGVMSMMARLVMADYAEILSTNNIGIYYAYALSSDDIRPHMERVGEADEVTFRTRLAMTRFLPQDMINEYYAIISQIFMERFGTYDGMQDLARIYGEELDNMAREVIASALEGQVDDEVFGSLTTNQAMIAYKYAQLVSTAQNPQSAQQLQSQLSSILQQSISSQSQILAFILR